MKDMRNFAGLEFSTFTLKPGVTESDLVNAVNEMVSGLYADDPEFLGHAVLKGEENCYVDVVFATSREHAERLCAKWGTGPFAEACLSYLEIISPDSVTLSFYSRLI